MARTAFLFPGQGSQFVGMGQDLADTLPEAKSRFDEADELLGVSLSQTMFGGPEDALKATEMAQPALFVHAYALFEALRAAGAPMPDAVAGHSLGEYTALVAAGALPFEAGLRLVRRRGEEMAKAGEIEPGAMAAVVGLAPDTLGKVLEQAADAGIVQAANFNAPGQIVVSGSVAGVERAMALAKGAGAKLVKALVVSGAFHSPLMRHAQLGLAEALDAAPFTDTTIPVYTNVTAAPETDGEMLRGLLLDQLTSPVRWTELIERMVADGITRFVEIGPGKVLQGLVKRIAPTAETIGVSSPADIDAFCSPQPLVP